MRSTRPNRRALLGLLAAAVVFRSVVFVLSAQVQFDSDQAITGLMAKHLSEGRAFPVFWYGQTYMLAVESWAAAPVMALLGPTVTALKLPLLAMNLAITWALFEILRRDGANDAAAAFATLFFALAAPITAAHYLTANGGNVEPLLYVLLIWMVRDRPVAMGAVLGLGFANREFTLYGAVALAIADLAAQRLFSRAALRRYAVALATAAAVWILLIGLQRVSSAAGPGTSVADLDDRLVANNVLGITGRLCIDVRAIASGFGGLLSHHLPYLFGLVHQPLTDFGIESAQWQGLPGGEWLLLAVLGMPMVRLLTIRRMASPASLYLVVVGVLSLAGYVAGRCGAIDISTMRYELLSPLAMAGLAAWYQQVEPSLALRRTWMTACAAVLAISVAAHVRLQYEYLTRPPIALKYELVRALEARGVRYGYTDYWVAYYVDFMTREHILLAPQDIVRIRTYNRIIDAHRADAVRISRRPCANGEQVTRAFWICPLDAVTTK